MRGAESLFALQVRPITVNPSRGGRIGTGQQGNVGAPVSRGNSADSEDAIDAILGRLSRHTPGGDPS
jgi:hypothetical protein